MNSIPQGRGSQFAREARIGLTIIAVLMTVFVWFAYRRFSTNPEPVADLRSEALQRHVSKSEQSAGTPDNPYGRTEITNRDSRINQAAPAPTAGRGTQAYGDNPAHQQTHRDPANPSTTAPARGNPALANPANIQSSSRVPPSYYDRGKASIAQGKASLPNVIGGDNELRPPVNKSQNRKPKQSTESSEDSLKEPVIEFGQEASLEDLEIPDSAPHNPVPNLIVKTEQSESSGQPAEAPNNFAAGRASDNPDGGASVTQLPAVRNGNTVGIRAEMISTTQNKTQTFFVEKNDTYWSISQRAYGTGHFYKALYEYNKGHVSDPENLPVGQKIVAPPINTLRSKYPHLIKQKDSINQTSYEQSDSAPPFQPRSDVNPQIQPDWPSNSFNGAMAKEQNPKDEDSIPTFDATPDLQQPKEFIPPVTTSDESSVEPAAAGDSQQSIPPAAEIPAATLPVRGEKPTSRPANIYTVREGDNLFDIARNELLQASRYLEILETNREHLPADCTHLTPLPAGLKLKLPDR